MLIDSYGPVNRNVHVKAKYHSSDYKWQSHSLFILHVSLSWKRTEKKWSERTRKADFKKADFLAVGVEHVKLFSSIPQG